jgi:hypothetical protein
MLTWLRRRTRVWIVRCGACPARLAGRGGVSGLARRFRLPSRAQAADQVDGSGMQDDVTAAKRNFPDPDWVGQLNYTAVGDGNGNRQ